MPDLVRLGACHKSTGTRSRFSAFGAPRAGPRATTVRQRHPRVTGPSSWPKVGDGRGPQGRARGNDCLDTVELDPDASKPTALPCLLHRPAISERTFCDTRTCPRVSETPVRCSVGHHRVPKRARLTDAARARRPAENVRIPIRTPVMSDLHKPAYGALRHLSLDKCYRTPGRSAPSRLAVSAGIRLTAQSSEDVRPSRRAALAGGSRVRPAIPGAGSRFWATEVVTTAHEREEGADTGTLASTRAGISHRTVEIYDYQEAKAHGG